ncbi:MAG: tetratricopeptide repeat protein [Desulfovibrionaceae bacterium]
MFRHEKRVFGLIGRGGAAICLCVVLVLCVGAVAASAAAVASTAPAASAVEMGEEAQQYLNAGENAKAAQVLRDAVAAHPDSDWLRSLYGRALYLEGRLVEAEEQFQKALEINRDNPVAKVLIQEVRNTENLLENRTMAMWMSLLRDKAGDLAVVVLGVWLGMLMTLFSEKFASLFKRSHFDRALKRHDWDVVTDILEYLMANWRKRELRVHMEKMLARHSKDEVEDIIRRYVDFQQHEDDLVFFLEKLHAKRQ